MTCLPSGTLTFLFTDLESSTRHWDENPAGMRVALQRHDEALREAIEGAGGTVFKCTGDGFCCVFTTAGAGFSAAIEAQRRLGALCDRGPVGTPALKTRIALHSGTAEERDGDYFGPTLNRTARLLAAGHGGQILISGAARQLLNDALARGAGLKDLGQHQLRSLLRPEQIYQALHPDLPEDFPPLSTPNVRRGNLPGQISRFVGRHAELAEVDRLLDTTRLLTLTGSGGCGKTRLCIEAAAEKTQVFPDGVWFVDLVGLRDSALVAAEVLSALAVTEGQGRPPAQALQEYLRDRTLLLILDNCEHLAAGCAELAGTLLRTCSRLRILATSRSPLGITGEQTYPVQPLAVPPRAPMTAADLDQYDGARLFVDRCRLQRPGFSVTEANAGAIAHICIRLDGIPLALELAAAGVGALPVQQIARRLDDRFRLLGVGSRAAAPHQQTLRATLDWSYDLLADGDQALFASLSVFSGGWPLDAAEEVCGQGPDFDVALALGRLTADSLISMDEDVDGESRYSMLETMREYAAERLSDSGESSQMRSRQAAWALHLAQSNEPRLRGADQRDALEQLETEHDNLRAALAWLLRGTCDGRSPCSGADATPGGDPGAAGLLAASLWRFWYARGHIAEGRSWLDEVADRFPPGDEATRARVLTALGNMAWAKDDWMAARDHFRRSLEIRRAIGDDRGAANSLSNLGNAASQQGDYETARSCYEESLTILRRLGDLWGQGSALNNLGAVCKDQRDDEAAQRLFSESAVIYRRLGDRSTLASVLNNHGQVAARTGSIRDAAVLLKESLEIRSELKDDCKVTGSIGSIASLLSTAGQPLNAARLLSAAVTSGRSLGMVENPSMTREREKLIDNLRAALGAAAFDRAWEEGCSLSLEDAAAIAHGNVTELTMGTTT